jgi:hypothetical protein
MRENREREIRVAVPAGFLSPDLPVASLDRRGSGRGAALAPLGSGVLGTRDLLCPCEIRQSSRWCASTKGEPVLCSEQIARLCSAAAL